MKSIAIGVHLRREHIEPLAIATPAGELFLSSVEVPEEQSLSDRDLLLRVAGIRAQLLERATFIAIRYGFTFRSVTEAAAKCAGSLERWKSVLTENRDRVELTLRVAASGIARPKRVDFSQGADYMKALHASTRSASIDEGFRSAVDELIVPLCVKHRWAPRDEKSIELAGLVERDRLGEVPPAGEALKKRCPQVPFLLSAPWPLEVFADADHE
jgi:hypothetical protein